MPNWCNNYLELEHEDPAMIERAKAAYADGRLLDEFIPCPKELHITASPGTQDADLRAQYDANIAKFGYSTWYEFQVNEWGTKWDVGGDGGICNEDGPNAVSMNFDSAWAPPIAAMEKFIEMGFKVKLYYYESGMCFAGIFDEDGDDYLDYSDMTADEVEAEINPDLDECMCIVENMRMWEEENEEQEESNENE